MAGQRFRLAERDGPLHVRRASGFLPEPAGKRYHGRFYRSGDGRSFAPGYASGDFNESLRPTGKFFLTERSVDRFCFPDFPGEREPAPILPRTERDIEEAGGDDPENAVGAKDLSRNQAILADPNRACGVRGKQVRDRIILL